MARNSLMAILMVVSIIPGSPAAIYAGRLLPDDPMTYSALVKMGNGSGGSGFYFNDGHHLYFATAKHVIFKEDSTGYGLIDNNISILTYSRNKHSRITINAQLPILVDGNNVKVNPKKDIALVRFAAIDNAMLILNNGATIINHDNAILTTVPITVLKTYDNVSIGNEIYIFGFPSSIGVQSFPQVEYDKPMLRKGIIAGKNEITRTLILDCFMFWGNSGGPVLEVDDVGNGSKEFRVVGIISQYVPVLEKWENIHGQTKLEVANSGYSIAEPIDDVLNLLRDW